MPYSLTTFDASGRKVATLGAFANIASARQAMLNHSKTVALPSLACHFNGLMGGLVEGWFIGSTEYNIEIGG